MPKRPTPDPKASPATPAASPPATPDAAVVDSQEKKRSKPRPKRPPIPLPDPHDADELLALDFKAVDRLTFEAFLRIGHAKRRRGNLLQAKVVDFDALHAVNGEISWLGALLSALSRRRTQLRVEARLAQGRALERSEAIAIAVDRVLSKPLRSRLLQEADKILNQSVADLARDPLLPS